MKRILTMILAAFLMTSCNENQESNSTTADDALAISTEDAVTTLSAILDDQANEAYATYQKSSFEEVIEQILFPQAYAANCVRPINLICNDGVQSSDFSDCSSFRGQVLASGNITLEYSQDNCSMASDGDQVSRTYDYELVGPRGGQFQVTSEDQEDYRGNTIGGGALLTKVPGGHRLEVLGKHKIFSRLGSVRRNHTIRTIDPLEISGGLSRNLRQVNNGQLEVIHNLAEFTATYTAEDLQWSSSCCHPVSGSLAVEYTGSVEGTASISFNSCGEAQIERDGETTHVEFTYCE